jgi:hypothetical protein
MKPLAVIVRVPGLIFNLKDFQRAFPLQHDEKDLKIEFIHGGSSIIRDYSLDSFSEALAAASPLIEKGEVEQ